VYPPTFAGDALIAADDAFDVPVLVRTGSPLKPGRRPLRQRIDAASESWPAVLDVPPEGFYLVTTTWRDIIDAAMTVGRDVAPWLSKFPTLASSELIARCSPLMAYLERTKPATAKTGGSGFMLRANAVYLLGTERTAQAAFGYRIGMTMAEWACRGLMGLGPTQHAEVVLPAGHGPAWKLPGLPDLVGAHWHEPSTWLVEAKGARRLGRPALSKGAQQLSKSGLMAAPHLRVLAGTSLEHRVFVTLDIEDPRMPAAGPAPAIARGPETDDESLLALARSRMLTYYALAATPPGSLSVRPVGPAVANISATQRHPGVVRPLEQDSSTDEERRLARDRQSYAFQRPSRARLDMLVAPIPGTGLIVGMSRRLYATCQDLADEDRRDIEIIQYRYPSLMLDLELDAEDPEESGTDIEDAREFIELNERRRAAFTEREAESHQRLLETARQSFDRGSDSTWPDLLATEPSIDPEPHAELLEAATTDTYLAISRRAIER
jgi:hypothetical protein